VVLHGAGRAGLWALLAAPASDALVADCAQFDSTNDENFLARDLFSPGLRKLGGFEGVAAINTGSPLLLHNVNERFSTGYLRNVYKKMRVPDHLRVETAALDDAKLAEWIAALKTR
jgi:hypothetical protein